jgi:RHS repeat-associated protein
MKDVLGLLIHALCVAAPLLLGNAIFAANHLPAKWGIQGELGPGCSSGRTGGFRTCQEAAAEFDRLHKICNPADQLQTDASNCGIADASYLQMFYIAPGGSPNSKGQVKSYCDDWNESSRFNLFITASYSASLGVHCPTSDYSMGRNAGMPDYCPNCMKGNPVNPGTGNKFQIEDDYAAEGPFPLRFTRYYNSLLSEDGTARLGSNWTHTFSRRLVFNAMADPAIVGAVREDGKEIPFNLVSGAYAPDPNFVEKLVRAGSQWKLTNSRDEEEIYDAGGKLISITNRNGLAQKLAYNTSNQLISVQDLFGRSLSFTYEGGGRIQTMTAPGGLVFQYSYATSGNSNLSGVTYPGDTTRTYHYENATFRSHLTGITDENGQRFSTYAYEDLLGFGLVASSELAGGAGKVTLKNSRASSTRNVTVVDFVDSSISAPRTYVFESKHGSARNNSISTPACPPCGPAARTYDGNGNTVTSNNWIGTRTHYKKYNMTRNLEIERDEGLTSTGASILGITRTISTQWHADYRVPTGIAEPLRITTMSYGSPTDPNPGNRGNLLSKAVQATTDASGALAFGATLVGSPRTWTYTYNTNGSVTKIDGPRDDVADETTYAHYGNYVTCPGASDSGCRGQVQTITNAAGQITQVTEYNAHGQPLRIVAPNGLVTVLAYDPRQRLISRNSGGEITGYTFSNTGLLTRVTLPDGSFLHYSYDNAHRLTQIADSLGNRITYTLDLAGNRTQEQVFDPLSQLAQTRSRVFDGSSRLTHEVGATGQTTIYGYDDEANVTSIDGPLNGTSDQTINTYDELSRLILVKDPKSGETRYAYDGLDQLATVTDPRKLLTTYSQDGLGNLNQQASPDTGSTINTYDLAGNLLTQTDAEGQTTEYAYDAINRVTKVTYQGGIEHNYTYDQNATGVGRLTQIVEPNSTTVHAYDPKGRLASETRVINGITYATGYAYDGAGRMTGMTYPSGRQVSYGFDSLGRIQLVTTTQYGATQAVAWSVAYQPFGSARTFTFGNDQTYARGFDQDGRVSNYTLAAQTIAVGYDLASRIVSLSDPAVPADASKYGYDTLDRLESFTRPGLSHAFSYDEVGNRLSKAVDANVDNYSYRTASNQLATITGANSRTYTHDLNGSVRSDSVNSYEYDSRGRLSSATSSQGKSTYFINSLGQRIRKTSSLDDTVYHYDARGMLIAESSASGATQKEYVYLHDQPLAILTTAAAPAERVYNDSTATRTGPWTLDSAPDAYLGDLHRRGGNPPTSSRARTLERVESTPSIPGQAIAREVRGQPARLMRAVDTPADIYKKIQPAIDYLLLTEDAKVVWTLTPPAAASYEVFARWVVKPGNTNAAVYAVHHAGGRTAVTRNQQVSGGQWVSLGTFNLSPGQNHRVELSGNAAGTVIADAVRISSPSTMVQSTLVHYIHTDHLNTPRLITNQAGHAVWRWDNHDPFGGNAPSENPSDLGAFTCNLRFAGQYFDKETNLHYNYFREYGPAEGRYIQSDPIGLEGGINTYAYVGGNPLSYIDPTGEFVWVPIAIGVALYVATQSSSFQNTAASSAQYWANQAAQSSNPVTAFGFSALGGAAALADPCTINTTATVLGVGAGAGAYLGRPFWQYYPAGSPAYSSPFLTRGWGWTPPYSPGPQAAAQLGLPPWNPGTAVRAVIPRMQTFVRGPTVVPRYTNPSYPGYVQSGGGVQFSIRAWPTGPLAPGPF